MHSTKTQLHGKIFGKSACVLCMEVSSSQPPQGLVKIIRKGAGDRERERGEEQGTESARVREQERERAREMIDSARAQAQSGGLDASAIGGLDASAIGGLERTALRKGKIAKKMGLGFKV
jgi:hypothetical protein